MWDDRALILNDPLTHKLWHVPRFFFRTYGVEGGDEGSRMNAGYYRPVVNTTFAVEYALFGKGPGGYHLTNVLLHVGVSCGVVAVVSSLSGSALAAVLAGLVFAVHPVHAESVAWISGRTDLLACLFMLWCIACLRAEAEGGGSRERMGPRSRRPFGPRPVETAGEPRTSVLLSPRLGVALSLFLLAVFSKELALMLPAFLLAGDWLMPVRSGSRLSVRRVLGFHLWFIVAAGLFLLLRAMALSGAVPPDMTRGAVLGARSLTSLKLVASHVWLLAFPLNLSAKHTIASGGWTDAGTLCGLVIVGLLAWWSVQTARQRAQATEHSQTAAGGALAGAWFLLMLLPVLNLVPIAEVFAERFAYAPSLGVCWAGALAVRGLRTARGRWLVAASLIPLSALAIDRAHDWQHARRLFAQTVRTAPESDLARFCLGAQYAETGLSKRAAHERDRSGELRPRFAKLHNGYGNLAMQLSLFDRAIDEFRAALEVAPQSPEYCVNLGRAYRARGDLRRALTCFSEALSASKDCSDAYFEIGSVHYLQRKLPEASVAFRAAIACDANYAEAHNNLALCLLAEGRTEEAEASLRRAVAAKPQYADAHRNLGYACAKLGIYGEALAAYRRALELRPVDVDTMLDLAMLARKHGDAREALTLYDRALRSSPKNERAARGRAQTEQILGTKGDGRGYVVPVPGQ